MIEKLFQAAAITLLLSLLTGIGSSKSGINPGIPGYHAFSLPVINPQLHVASIQLSDLR